jgi:hypothetical protein
LTRFEIDANLWLRLRLWSTLFLILIIWTLGRLDAQGAGIVLFGDQTIETQSDHNVSGQAEAFQTTASATGTLGSITIYIDSRSTAPQIFVGLYADNSGHPGTLLTQGSLTQITIGAWNTISVPSISVISGTKYWIAILGTGAGTPFFRDRSRGPCTSEANAQTSLASLPATWSSGAQFSDCPISAYGTAAIASQPVLNVSSTALTFNVTQGGTTPPPQTLNVTNTGSGALSFSVTSDQGWLTVTPISGNAPQSLTVTATTDAVAHHAGTYTGHLTITAPGAQGSPTTVTVTLIVSPAPPPQPILAISPAAVSFNATQGGANPSSQNVSITNAGSGTLSFSVATDQTWLSASPTSGNAPQSVALTATTGNLSPGTYTGHVTVTSSGTQGSPASVTVTFNVASPVTVLLGDNNISPSRDSNSSGQAEAFQTMAAASGTLSTLSLYVDSASTAQQIIIGLYSDNGGNPGTLLTSASTTQVSVGAWNTLTVPGVNITSGTKYWIAILGTQTGTIAFRNGSGSGCGDQGSAQNNLTTLPLTWSSGSNFGSCFLSSYGSTAGASGPVLNLSTTTLSFAATQGGGNPPTAPVTLTNAGSGTLSYTVTSDQTWLTATPTTGNAPQSLTVTATTGTLGPGTYTGHLTVTAAGAQSSPATVTVTFVVSAPPPPQPVLTLSASTLTFSATQGGGNPPTQSINITNSGSSTLSFTAATDQTWLSIQPTSGSAPQSLTVTVTTGSLAAGTYTGHITVTAPGAQGSPASVTVTFNVTSLSVSQPGDWLMVEHDSGRSGFASDENILSTSNASTLAFRWATKVDGQVTAQPLFVGGILISSQTHDVVIAATSGNSIYALDAVTGSQLWKRNFGSQPANCVFPGGFGITGAPLIDRRTGRIYAVSDDGQLRTISLFDGTDAAPALPLITSDIVTNKVWGGLNQFGNSLYVPTASNGCDSQPWRGRIFQVNVSASPALSNTFTVVPSIPAPDGGGGIWGYGGVSIDTATSRVYAGSGQDSNNPEALTPNADSMLALDANVNLLGSFQASHPSSFPCSGQPCDLDFASTPVVFSPSSCPTMLAMGNKNGILYVSKAADLAASLPPLQSLTLNTANDSLGSGGIGGTPAYWSAARMLFVGDTGPGANGVKAGLVALAVQSDCTLKPVWSVALGAGDQPNSTPTAANGVVLIGEANVATVHAYDALTGTELWNSGKNITGSVYAAPMIAKGWVYVGSWNGFGATSGGTITAFSVNPPSTPILNVSPGTLTFSAIQGGVNPPSTPVSISNSGSGTLSYTVSSDQPWLSAAPGSGQAPQSLMVTATTGSLGPGTYTGHLTVTAAGAQGSPATVTVTFVVSAPPPPQPVLTLSSSALTFSATQGGGNPPTQSIGVTNSGSSTLSFTAATDQAWLSVQPTSGSAPQSLTVTVTTGSLTAGTYTGHITVTAPGAQGSPASATVTFNVSISSPPGTPLLGTQTIESNRDTNPIGAAEAFQATATANGTLGSLSIYLDASNSVQQLTIGLYSDNGGHPGTLLAQGSTTQMTNGVFNAISVSPVNIISGTPYWIAILGTQSGTFAYRDSANSSCGDEGSAQTNLTSLPATWTTGKTFGNCPLSGYGSSK